MENKRKRKYILIKIILFAMVTAGVVYYAYSFPRTMELLDKAINNVMNTVGLEAEISVFSDFSVFSKEAVEKAIYLTELIKENINGRIADGKRLPVAIITCAAKFPSEGKIITSDFGRREDPISGKTDNHTGIDIAAVSGSDVTSAWPGTVIETGYDEIYGNYLVIEHSKDFSTKYCHLSAVTVKKDTFVNAGEKIGEAGSTGRSTGSHLHFEVCIGGRNIDPKECFGL